jgi:hypothetical protein
VIAFDTPKRQTIFCQKNFWTMAKVIVAMGLALIHFEKYFTATTTYFKFPCLVGVGQANLGPTFIVAKWDELVGLKTKVVPDL